MKRSSHEGNRRSSQEGLHIRTPIRTANLPDGAPHRSPSPLLKDIETGGGLCSPMSPQPNSGNSRYKRASISTTAEASLLYSSRQRSSTNAGENAAAVAAARARRASVDSSLPGPRSLSNPGGAPSGGGALAVLASSNAMRDYKPSLTSSIANAIDRTARRRSVDFAALRQEADRDRRDFQPVSGHRQRVAESYASKLGLLKDAPSKGSVALPGLGKHPKELAAGNSKVHILLDLNPRAMLEDDYFKKGVHGHFVATSVVDRGDRGGLIEDEEDAASSRSGPGARGGPGPTSVKRDFTRVHHWQGEAPHRFAVLTGSTLISERELAIVHTLFIESNEDGQLTVDGLKRFVRKANGAQNLKHSVDLALALCQVLKRRETKISSSPGLPELVSLAWPTLPAEDIEFLTNSVETLRFSNGSGNDAPKVPMRALSQHETQNALSVYGLLEKNDSGGVAVDVVIAKAVGSFPQLDTYMLYRQMYKVLPRTYKNCDQETFLKFLAVHLAGKPCLSLAEWSAVLRGSDAVISRWVHRNESLKDAELEQLFSSRPAESGVLRALYSEKNSGGPLIGVNGVNPLTLSESPGATGGPGGHGGPTPTKGKRESIS